MSRSYKKNPVVTDDSQHKKYMKRIANKVVRRRLKDAEDLPTRLPHKKMTETWMICDYKWRMTKTEAIQWYETEASDSFKKKFPTLETWLKYWAKCHVRK